MKNDHIRIRESGWAPTPSDLEAFSEELGVINLELKYWKNTPPSATFDDTIERNLERNLPTIVVVDAKKIQGLDSTDGQHATVVTGMSENHIVLADPWQGKLSRLNKEIVTDAWDTQLNRLITIDSSVQDSIQQNTELPDIT
jgi:ABC-type bacteriocin/lantibiotic exporter with double-glycine peptidase domain